ncbi:MAG: lipid-A-disaccharide synthase [Rhodobacteraceae bacterium]|nr:lipid-A-disaccharide synthase [Paracoccaceae bacterium]
MRVFILAGEVSGDLLGGALMSGLKQLCPDISFEGIGGAAMQAQGLTSRFPMEELSVMGLAEVLPKYFHLKRRIAETAQAVIDMQPDVLITIDSPDFSLRVAKLVKAGSDIRTVHYVAPSVWAWRAGRAAKMAKVIDHVLALLPFEPPYMTAEGMDCDFVGHPIAAKPVARDKDVADMRARLGLDDAPYLLVLPGSRRSEVARLAPIFGLALHQIAKTHPDLRFVLPVATPVTDLINESVANWPVRVTLVSASDDPDGNMKLAAFKGAKAALAASGTVSLELAASDTPMVIAYTFNWLTLQIMKRMIRIDTVTLVNLVSETRSVPECLGADCTPDQIAAAMTEVMANPTAQHEAMRLTMERLGRGAEDPGLRAARAVLARLPGSVDG